MTSRLLFATVLLVLVATASSAAGPADRLTHAGVARVDDGLLVDDGGPFWAVGATYMAAPWFMKFDRARLERNLAFLASGGIDYIRVLGEVGGRYWTGREIDPGWPDYEEVVADLTDLAYDRYGLRVQWTVFGGTPFSHSPEARAQLVDRIVRVLAERPHKVMLLEIGNEAWKNGFGGPAGQAELRGLVTRARQGLRGRGIALPVAPSAPSSSACGEVTALYQGLGADILLLHTSRDTRGSAGAWGPALELLRRRPCTGEPSVIASNEPIGAGSSVTSEEDSLRLVSAAAASFLAGAPLHVFHSRAGVRGEIDFASLPNVRATLDGLAALHRLLPRDLARGTRVAPGDDRMPFELLSPLARDIHSQRGVLAMQVAQLGQESYAAALGVRGPLSLRARTALEVAAYDMLTGEVVRQATLGPGGLFEVTGREALLIKARR